MANSLLVKENRIDYVRFIRAMTGLIALRIKSKLAELKTIFTLRPFTRILEWGKDFKNTKDYVFQNQLEAFGHIRRQSLTTVLTKKYFSDR